MESGDAWRAMFEGWPASIPRTGILVTTFNEQIPFVNYLISGGILLLERDKPDSYGARKVMVSYTAISGVKITSAMELGRFQAMGFQAPF